MNEDEQLVRVSTCKKCNCIITALFSYLMTPKEIKRFNSDVEKYNLNDMSIPFLEYQKLDMDWCECNTPSDLI
jgi:hypothetical protein